MDFWKNNLDFYLDFVGFLAVMVVGVLALVARRVAVAGLLEGSSSSSTSSVSPMDASTSIGSGLASSSSN